MTSQGISEYALLAFSHRGAEPVRDHEVGPFNIPLKLPTCCNLGVVATEAPGIPRGTSSLESGSTYP